MSCQVLVDKGEIIVPSNSRQAWQTQHGFLIWWRFLYLKTVQTMPHLVKSGCCCLRGSATPRASRALKAFGQRPMALPPFLGPGSRSRILQGMPTCQPSSSSQAYVSCTHNACFCHGQTDLSQCRSHSKSSYAGTCYEKGVVVLQGGVTGCSSFHRA